MMQHLGRGADAAKSIGQLAEDMNLHRRSVETLLEGMVKSGIPVIANHRGVYLAQTPQEARQYAESLRGRIGAIQARVTALETWAEIQELSGQEAFPWAA
jgi:hypothetical protein